jgi:predicted site-specific integrase-resolvase
MAEHSTGERLLPMAKAAQALGVHPNTLRAWTDKGLVPFVRLPSGVRRFSQAQLAQIRAEMYSTGKSAADKRLRPAAA